MIAPTHKTHRTVPSPAPAASGEESRFFGFREVEPEAKTGLVRGVFDRVASRYDVMNDAMSAGIHRLWKAELIRMIRPRADRLLVDLAGGTGDIAFRWHDRAGPDSQVIVCDINTSMLAVGRDRAIDHGRLSGIDWVCGNAEALPFPDRTADTITIAFGLRNVTRIDAALREARRVLRPGGRFFCLEFSRVRGRIPRAAYDAYSFAVIPALGQMIAGDAESYRYLVESIRRFPDQQALAGRMQEAGFDRVAYRNLSGGIAAIHSGARL